MKYVALLQNGNYEYGHINEEGKFEWKSELNGIQFPRVNFEIFTIITEKLNIPNLGYMADGDGFAIFDKSKEEYVEYEVPVLVKVFDELKVTKKRTKLVIPTEKTIKRARDMYYNIEHEIFRINHMEDIDKLNKEIVKEKGIAWISLMDYPCLESIFLNCNEFKKLFSYKYENYIVGIKQDDSNKILKLNVPKEVVGKVIGKGGKNVKNMAEKLGVKKIEVIGM